MKRNVCGIVALLFILVITQGVFGQRFDNVEADALRISAKATVDVAKIAPGGVFKVALEVTLAEGWSWYSNDPGPDGKKATVSSATKGFLVTKIDWPAPKDHVYTGTTAVMVHISVDAKTALGRERVELIVGQQICDDSSCVPLEGRDAVSAGFDITVAGEVVTPIPPPVEPDKPVLGQGDSASGRSVLVWFAFAILAGLAMNITPCVLPIIPLRIYGIVQMAGGSRRRFVTLGLAFAAGIVLFFALVAMLNIGLHFSLSRGFKWSEQWQYPLVRVSMILILVAVAANMFGLFTVTVPKKISAIEAGADTKEGQGHLSSLGMGLMMAILSTPCTAAALAGVLGWAQGESLLTATAAFILLGIGMAAPHAILAAFPSLLKLLPKPGVWMEWFKQSMGFAILGVAAYMLSSFSQDGYVGYVGLCGVLLAFCLWVWGTWVRFDAPLKRRVLVRGFAIITAVVGGYFMLQPPADAKVSWVPYSAGQVAAAQGEGKIVVVKFTATWCGVCKRVDKIIFHDDDVANRLKDVRYLAVKADTSESDMPASEFLNKYFPKHSIPLTVVFSPDKNTMPITLPGVYTKEDFFNALETAEVKIEDQ